MKQKHAGIEIYITHYITYNITITNTLLKLVYDYKDSYLDTLESLYLIQNHF